MKFLIKVTPENGDPYFVRSGGYIEKTLPEFIPVHWYYHTNEMVEQQVESYRQWNDWYNTNHPGTEPKKRYEIIEYN